MTPLPNSDAMITARTTDRANSGSRVVEILRNVVSLDFMGIVLIKSEGVSWYRIQEMFRFQAFHMYGLLGSAMMTALISIQILTRTGARALTGANTSIPDKEFGRGRRYWFGGTLFGIGWAFTGACPRPLLFWLEVEPRFFWRSALRRWRGRGCMGICARICRTSAKSVNSEPGADQDSSVRIPR